MNFLAEAEKLFPETAALRRKLHQTPELAFAEYQTAALVAEELTGLGFAVETGLGGTGVSGYLQGKSPKPLVMLRFDMDALPMQEESGVEYASQNPGVMHACGHDAHTAIGITTARLLAGHREELDASFLLVFQPAEEIGQGAQAMLEDGLFSSRKPDFALGVHVWNSLPSGSFVIKTGELMAGSGFFEVRLRGKGGHAALPHQAVDPIAAGARIVSALQSITAQKVNPLDAAVVGVTMFHAGTASNIIPELAELLGTIRFFSHEIWTLLCESLTRIVHDTASASGCTAEIKLVESTPPLVNDAFVAGAARKALGEILPDAVLLTDYRTMGSEDMAFFLEQVPGVFIFVGSGGAADHNAYPHHHPRFDIDESVMASASAILLQTAYDLQQAAAMEDPL
ncbi:MAG: amidohydrolase [Anaerolineaceae bacterium]